MTEVALKIHVIFDNGIEKTLENKEWVNLEEEDMTMEDVFANVQRIKDAINHRYAGEAVNKTLFFEDWTIDVSKTCAIEVSIVKKK